ATSPYVRSDFGVAFDSVRSRLLAFGGLEQGRGWGNDLWSFDGATWTQIDLNAPDEVQNTMLAREPGHIGAIAFGGQDEYFGYLQSTWRWDGAAWHPLSPVHMPAPRGMGALTFDPATNTTLLF